MRFRSLFLVLLLASPLSAQTPVAIPDTLDLPTALSYALENNFAIRPLLL